MNMGDNTSSADNILADKLGENWKQRKRRVRRNAIIFTKKKTKIEKGYWKIRIQGMRETQEFGAIIFDRKFNPAVTR